MHMENKKFMGNGKKNGLKNDNRSMMGFHVVFTLCFVLSLYFKKWIDPICDKRGKQ